MKKLCRFEGHINFPAVPNAVHFYIKLNNTQLRKARFKKFFPLNVGLGDITKNLDISAV